MLHFKANGEVWSNLQVYSFLKEGGIALARNLDEITALVPILSTLNSDQHYSLHRKQQYMGSI